MATYCVSDIHGCFDKYMRLLEKIGLSQDDTLYIIGDLLDRGPQPMAQVLDAMSRKNVVSLAGNHELQARMCLKKLIYGGRKEDLDEKSIMGIFLWRQNGGASTLADFHKLSIPERREIVDWLGELDLYREVEAGGEVFVLVHAGFGQSLDPNRPPDDYTLEDYLFARPDYSKGYPDKYIVSGHTPTRLIPENPNPDRIYRANRHIAIDCGCVFGGKLGAICLDTGEEFYV